VSATKPTHVSTAVPAHVATAKPAHVAATEATHMAAAHVAATASMATTASMTTTTAAMGDRGGSRRETGQSNCQKCHEGLELFSHDPLRFQAASQEWGKHAKLRGRQPRRAEKNSPISNVLPAHYEFEMATSVATTLIFYVLPGTSVLRIRARRVIYPVAAAASRRQFDILGHPRPDSLESHNRDWNPGAPALREHYGPFPALSGML
jgi:hypothetical protein